MDISLSDTLKAFIDYQVSSGRSASPSAYVEQLIKQDQGRHLDAELLQQVNNGAPLSVDEHFDARVESLLQAQGKNSRHNTRRKSVLGHTASSNTCYDGA